MKRMKVLEIIPSNLHLLSKSLFVIGSIVHKPKKIPVNKPIKIKNNGIKFYMQD